MHMGEEDLETTGAYEHVPELFDYPAATRKRSEEGTVVAVRGDTADVLLRRSRFCEGCGSCCVLVDSETMLAEAANIAGARQGDRVLVELPIAKSIRAAYILYGVPLLAFLIGLAVGGLIGYFLFGWGFNVPLALLFAIAFLALSYVLLSRIYAPGTRTSSRYRLTVTKVLK